MKKSDFERCTSEATKLLYQQNISDRILNIQKLTYVEVRDKRIKNVLIDYAEKIGYACYRISSIKTKKNQTN